MVGRCCIRLSSLWAGVNGGWSGQVSGINTLLRCIWTAVCSWLMKELMPLINQQVVQYSSNHELRCYGVLYIRLCLLLKLHPVALKSLPQPVLIFTCTHARTHARTHAHTHTHTHTPFIHLLGYIAHSLPLHIEQLYRIWVSSWVNWWMYI